MKRDSEIHAIAREFTRGNSDAFEWFCSVLDLSNLWDHVVDGDEVDKVEADSALTQVTVGWGLNGFFLKNGPLLAAVNLNAIEAWKASGMDGNRVKAFDVATEVGTTVAFLCGGVENARAASAKLRAWAWNQQRKNDAKG